MNVNLVVAPFSCGAIDPTTPYRCPATASAKANQCVSDYSACGSIPTVVISCPASQTACSSNGFKQCVSDVNTCPVGTTDFNCPNDGRTWQLCPSGECRLDVKGCGAPSACPPGSSLCPDALTCAIQAADCPAPPGCPAGQYQCRDGRCATRRENCGTDVACPYGGVVCPDGSCRASANACPQIPACVAPTSLRCPNGACRARIADCPTSVTCPSGWALCESGQCRLNVTDCPTSTACSAGIRCPDGTCAPDTLLCPSQVSCPIFSDTNAPGVLCASGACVSDVSQCPPPAVCSSNMYQCPGGGCASNRTACPTNPTCPPFSPVLCPDGSCQSSVSQCVSMSGSACQMSNNQAACISMSLSSCPLRFPIRCLDGSCVANSTNCPIRSACPPFSPFRCPDGSCVAANEMCFSTTTPALLAKALTCSGGLIRCPSGACAPSLAECGTPLSCPPGSSRCVDGTCRSQCPAFAADYPFNTPVCSSNQIQCPQTHQGVSCALQLSDCPQAPVCPPEAPVRCADASCALSQTDCPGISFSGGKVYPCPNGGWITSTTGQCATSTTCPPFAPVKCWDETCRVMADDCPPRPLCPSATPYLCKLGTCMASVDAAGSCSVLGTCTDPAAPILCPTGSALACVSSVSQCDNWFNVSVSTMPTLSDSFTPYSITTSTVSVNGGQYFMCPNAPFTPRTRCKDGSCGGSNPYMFSAAGACRPMSCPNHLPFLCPEGMCARRSSECSVSNGCPFDSPTKCADGSCTDKASSCPAKPACTSGTLLCPDGSCRTSCTGVNANGCTSSQDFCHDGSCQPKPDFKTYPNALSACIDGTDIANACPANRPVRCPDGVCAISNANCPIFSGFKPTCTNPNKAFTCADGTCVAYPEQCRVLKFCDPTQTRCSDGTCKPSADQCPSYNPCPSDRPYRCTGTNQLPVCVATIASCPDQLSGCPTGYTKCSTGVCVSSLSLCPVMSNNGLGCPSSTPNKCPNGECVSDLTKCNAPSGCPYDKPYLWPSGGCQSTKYTGGTQSTSCPSGKILCPNGQCADSASDATCQMSNGCQVLTPVRCANGQCAKYPAALGNVPAVQSGDVCPPTVVCDSWKPFLCPDSSCAVSASHCRPIIPQSAPSAGQEICSNLVLATAGSCAKLTSCPATRPTICPDGSCRTSLADCGAQTQCPLGTVLCFDGTCQSSPKTCISRQVNLRLGANTFTGTTDTNSTCPSATLCWDGRCVPTSSMCPLVPGCPASLPLRCPDGSCVNGTCSASSPQCSPNLQLCEDGICRSQCLPYAGCPISNTPYYCAGRTVSCTQTALECLGDVPTAAPTIPSRRRLLAASGAWPYPTVASNALPNSPPQEACKDNCYRDILAQPQYVSISPFQSVSVDVGLDSVNAPRTQLIFPAGAYGNAATTIAIQPVPAHTLDNLVWPNAPAGAWYSIPWHFSQRVLSTPFKCSHTTTPVPTNVLNVTVLATIDRTVFDPTKTISNIVQVPCLYITGPKADFAVTQTQTATKCTGVLNIYQTSFTYKYNAGSCPSGTPMLNVAGNLASVTYKPAGITQATLCFNLTSSQGSGTVSWSVGDLFCLAFDASNANADIVLYEYNVRNTGIDPSSDSPSAIKTSSIKLEGTLPAGGCNSNGGLNTIPSGDVCLGVYDSKVNYFHCVDASYYTRTDWPTYNGSGPASHVNYHLPNGCDQNTYAFVWITMPAAPAPPSSNCDIWCMYKAVILGVVIGFVVFSVVAGYAIYRLIRYRRKYKEKQAALTDLRERAQHLDEFAGGLGVADEEVDMVANPLVIEMQELEKQIKKVNEEMNVSEERETREIDTLEIERQRLHAEIQRVKQLMAQQQRAAPQRVDERPAFQPALTQTSSSSAPSNSMQLTQSQQLQRHDFGQARKPGRKEVQ